MAARTATKTKSKAGAKAPEQAKSAGAVAVSDSRPPPTGLRLRVPYPRVWGEAHGISIDRWKVLIDTAWPAALTAEAVCLAIEYCRWRKLDPLKKMVHIVPVWAKDGGGYDAQGKPIGGMIETVWPGIAEIRVTASRTGSYAGKDAMVFGPDAEETFTHTHDNKTSTKTVTYPEWAQLTVYRIVQGQRCAFVGPKVKWKEAYATESRWSTVPNEMWADRSQGQLDKCAEAAALRAAFPEELGGEQAAEEMYGRIVEHAPQRMIPETAPLAPGEVRPPNPGQSEFAREPAANPPKPAAPAEELRKAEGDQRPEPPAIGELPLPEPVAKGPEIPTKGVDQDWFQDKLKELQACAKIGAVGELSNLVEQDLPPESPELKIWARACKAKTDEIQEALRRTKP